MNWKINKKIGVITNKIINLLMLDLEEEVPIFIGEANINHIMEGHFTDYEKYGTKIKNIIKSPTYLARNEKKKSIEFIKEYKQYNDFVLIVVRASRKNTYFIRTMYVMDKEKVEKYRKHNYFIKFDT